MSHLGEIAALATAVTWAGAALAFATAGRRIGAVTVNLVRIPIAVVLLGMLHLARFGSLWPSLGATQAAYLAASGVVGLALGDLFYFQCLASLGPRIGALLMATHPVQAALLAIPFLGEPLSPAAILGIPITLVGVGIVLLARGDESAWAPGRRLSGRGVAFGLLGALGQAGGLVLSKLGMVAEGDAGIVDPLSATLMRMVAGMLAMWTIGFASGAFRRVRDALADRAAMLATTAGAVLGPTFGVWLSLVAVQRTSAGVAAALMATMPVMMLPIARVAYGSRPDARAVFGTMLAVAGGAVLFLGKH